jgi:eukaryotic-like serine/threonine-protein kinase
LIGAIIDHQPPPVTTYQSLSPPLLDEIVARCLAKDPDDRWQTVRDLKRQLEWVASRLDDRPSVPQPTAASRSSRTFAYMTGAFLLGTVMIAAGVAWTMRPAPRVTPVVTRVALELPAGQAFTRMGRHLLALSPNGERLVYVANQQLYLREMRNLAITPIAGTEGLNPAEPIFSPDGEWVAFWTNGDLKKVPVAGGSPVMIGPAQTPFGASWVGDRILLGQTTPRGIVEFPSGGGPSKLVVGVDEAKGELAHGPQLLNDGRSVLFTLRTGPTAWDVSAVVIQDLATGKRQVLVNGGTDARVLPTGHLVYSREATLFAMTFDAERLVVTGSAVPVQDGIQQSSAGGQSGAAQMAWSAQGIFAFVPGTSTSVARALVWVDRNGKPEFPSAPPKQYSPGGEALRISPDGSQAAVAIIGDLSGAAISATDLSKTGMQSDIWVWNGARGSLTRLTTTGKAFSPNWTADGRRICHDNGREAFCQAADGSGQPELMFAAQGLVGIEAITADRKRLLFSTNVKGNFDLLMATVGPPLEVRPLLHSPFSESKASISPDGRWLAYSSNESGRTEVYVRPFPLVDEARWQVSTDGGTTPRWSSNGRELFFTLGGGNAGPPTIFSAAVQSGATFVAQRPAAVVKLPNTASFAYDVAPDGRFLLHLNASAAREDVPRPRIVIVQHWFEELNARMRSMARP